MKNTIFILFTLALFINVSGQETRKTNYQVNFGVSMSIPYKSQIESEWNVDIKPITYFKSDIDYFAELMLSYNFNNRMLLKSGASFINSNLQAHRFVDRLEQDAIIQTNYLGTPLIFD